MFFKSPQPEAVSQIVYVPQPSPRLPKLNAPLPLPPPPAPPIIAHTVNSLLAVDCRDVCLNVRGRDGKQYVNIINNLSLYVPSGTIFGLVGPSGCGKTSFLRCLIGYLKPTSGSIRVFGYRPGEPGSGVPGRYLGYMPQEISLNDDLTVDEMLTYFGRLFITDRAVLEKRKDELYQLLDLSQHYKQIKNLSGGQKRRVSFACSVINRPKLAILDEPTVGCDPLLRERIWSFLEKLIKLDKTAVLITTHYIEETTRSNWVAFMRNGKIIAQSNPIYIMNKFQSKTLEDTFLQICNYGANTEAFNHPPVDEKTLKQNNVNEKADDSPIERFRLPYIHTSYKDQTRGLYIVTERIFLRLSKQKPFLYSFCLAQIVGIIVFANFFCRAPHHLPIGIFNEDTPPILSKIFVEGLNESKLINQLIEPKYFQNYSDAYRETKLGRIYGFVHIPKNFSDLFLDRLLLDESFNSDQNNSFINQTQIRFHGDLTNKVISTTIERVLQINYNDFVLNVLRDYNYNVKLSDNPFVIKEPIFGKIKIDDNDFFSYKEYMLPQLISYLLYSFATESVIFNLIREKTELMFERNYALGVTSDHLLLGHFLSAFLANSIFAVPYFFTVIYFFNLPCVGSFSLAFILILLQIGVGVSTGMIFSACTESFFLLSISTLAFLWGSFFLGGIMTPEESLPYFLKLMRYIVPFIPSSESLQAIMVKGFNFTYPSVYISCLSSLLFMSILLSITRLIFKYSR